MARLTLNNIIYFTLISLLFLSCNKDEENPAKEIPKVNKAPQDFKITPEKLTGTTIEVSFSESFDPDYEPVKYRLYLNDSLVADNLNYSVKSEFTNLIPLKNYKITIIAFDAGGMTNSQFLNVKTLADGAQIINHKLQFEEKAREYGLYLPSGSQYQNLPLVIYLHGAGGIIWPGMINNYFVKMAERDHFIFLQPQALVGDPSGEGDTGWDAHNLLPWNDVSFINSIIDTLYQKGLIDLSRIYVTGMSNGGFMTFTVAEKLQDRIAAIAPIAGLMDNVVFAQYNMRKPMPLCYMHGTADHVVEIEGSQFSQGWSSVLSLWIDINGTSSTPVVTEMPDINKDDNSTVTKFEYHSYSGNGEIVYYRINNGGHSVPGLGYPTNMDINAFEEIWNFFKNYTLQK